MIYFLWLIEIHNYLRLRQIDDDWSKEFQKQGLISSRVDFVIIVPCTETTITIKLLVASRG